jgi:hypothetical protein
VPKYFFHIVRSGHRVEDTEGIELPDIAAAAREAMRSTGDMVRESVKQHERYPAHTEVTDETGTAVIRLPFPG